MQMTDQEFLEKLAQHPKLKNRFKEMLAIATNSGDELITLADEAELRVIGQVRQLGQELLQDWANDESKRIAANIKAQIPLAKKHIKKNSGGTPHTAK